MKQPDFHSGVARKRHVKKLVSSSRKRRSEEEDLGKEERKKKSEVCAAVFVKNKFLFGSVPL